jgi:1-deoxy-D-xylulose-5-phosphate synthase
MPNLTVLAPRDTTELRQMVNWMSFYDQGPSAVRYPRGSSDDRLPEARTPIQLGRSETIRLGRDLTIAAIGSMVSIAYEAAVMLAEEGIEAEVINGRFLKPFDADNLIASIGKTGQLITIEENSRSGGYGEMCRDALHEAGLGGVPHRLIALPDAFVEHGTQAILREQCGLSANAIVEAARKMTGSRTK